MKNTDLISLFERSLRDLPEEQLEERKRMFEEAKRRILGGKA